MNRIKIFPAALMVLLSGLVLVSCQKTFDNKIPEQLSFDNSARVQVIIATVNAQRNNVFVDGNKISGAVLVSGSVFPASGLTANVTGGLRAFLVKDDLATSPQIPLSFSENMQVAKRYTIFMYDTITTPKQKTVVTNVVIPDGNSARLRFANFVYSPFGIPAYDVYSARKQANIFTNVQVSDVTEFITIPSGLPDTLYLRPTGTTTNLKNFTPSTATPPGPGTWADLRLIFTPTVRRNYTLLFRGSHSTSTTTNANVRTLSLIADQ